MNLIKTQFLAIVLIISVIAIVLIFTSPTLSEEYQYVDSFCKTYYKDSDRVKNASYWTVEENDYMAICYIGKQFNNKFTLIVKDNKKEWTVSETRGSNDDLAFLRKTLIGYRYDRKEWNNEGLPTSKICKSVSESIAAKQDSLMVHKYLFDSYNISELMGSDGKYIKSMYNCITEFIEPRINGGYTYTTYVIEYNKDNDLYEYKRDKRYEAGGTAIPVETYIKKIIKHRKSKDLY